MSNILCCIPRIHFKFVQELVKNKDVLKELTAKPSTASEASQKPAQQPLVNGDVGHAPGQDKSPSSRLLYANAKKTNLQGKAKVCVVVQKCMIHSYQK